MYDGLRLGSQDLSLDYHRPITVSALKDLDRDLVLVWSKTMERFLIMRKVPRCLRFRLSDGTRFAYIETVLAWQETVDEEYIPGDHGNLHNRDWPWPIIDYLKAGDKGPNGERIEDMEREANAKILAQRAAQERYIDDAIHGAVMDNKHQLLKAWAPFRDYTGMVR